MIDVIKDLADSREEFLASVAGVPEEQAKLRPAPGRWSVLECVEHVITVEGRFMGRLRNPEVTPAPAEDPQKEATLAQRLVNREEKRQAPDGAQPKGRLQTLAQGVEEFHAARAESIAFAGEKGAALRTLSTQHAFFGPINGMELMVIMAAHTRRHAAQLREIKEQLGAA